MIVFSVCVVFLVIWFALLRTGEKRRSPAQLRERLHTLEVQNLILEERVALPLEALVRQAEEDAEAEYRRYQTDQAREDFVHGIGRYGV